MNKTAVVYFSTRKENLNQLLIALKKCINTSLQFTGFHDKITFQNFLLEKASVKKIQVVVLDINESNKKVFHFLNNVNRISPNTLKLIVSDNIHLLNIQTEFKNNDSFQYFNRSWSEIDCRIALKSVNHSLCNLQILLNHRSDVSGYSKKLEEKISFQIKELNESNMAKDKFFSIIAHDLKSPFTALLGISEILISEWDEITDKEKLDLVKGLKYSSENTYELLENLLIWSKTQMKKIEVNPEIIQINKIINGAVEISKTCAYHKQIQIENQISKELMVICDKNMISTVFRNLLSNAVNYIGHSGKIEISAIKDNEFCTFCVADDGDGISQEHILHYFKSGNTQKLNGNSSNFKGLGLLLCKDFIESNGGQIWLETENGKGSKFYFTIPLAINSKSIINNK